MLAINHFSSPSKWEFFINPFDYFPFNEPLFKPFQLLVHKFQITEVAIHSDHSSDEFLLLT
jgi:hypothetical protein